MKSVLITGANGFVGRHVLAALQADNLCDVVIPVGHSGGTGPSIDLTDPVSVRNMVKKYRPDAIIHLASIASPNLAEREVDLAWAVNFRGVLALAEAILTHSPQTRLVFSGSAHAYGRSFGKLNGKPITESAPLEPKTTYAATKACADLALGQMTENGLDCIRFRSFNHTGPGQKPEYVVPEFARQVAKIEIGEKPPVIRTGNIGVKRDFLDVRDVARAYSLAALTEGLPPAQDSVFNLASGKAIALTEVLQILAQYSSAEFSIEEMSEKRRVNDFDVVFGDNSRVTKVLGWQPEISIEQTVFDVLQDQRMLLQEERQIRKVVRD